MKQEIKAIAAFIKAKGYESVEVEEDTLFDMVSLDTKERVITFYDYEDETHAKTRAEFEGAYVKWITKYHEALKGYLTASVMYCLYKVYAIQADENGELRQAAIRLHYDSFIGE